MAVQRIQSYDGNTGAYTTNPASIMTADPDHEATICRESRNIPEGAYSPLTNGATDMAPISVAVDGRQYIAVLSPSGTQDSAAHAGLLNLGVPTGVANEGHSIFVFALAEVK